MATAKQRKAATREYVASHRDRRKAAGLKRIDVWIHSDDERALRDEAARLIQLRIRTAARREP